MAVKRKDKIVSFKKVKATEKVTEDIFTVGLMPQVSVMPCMRRHWKNFELRRMRSQKIFQMGLRQRHKLSH